MYAQLASPLFLTRLSDAPREIERRHDGKCAEEKPEDFWASQRENDHTQDHPNNPPQLPNGGRDPLHSDPATTMPNGLRRDHRHLKQIHTYAAALQTVTLCWITERFAEEHLVPLD